MAEKDNSNQVRALARKALSYQKRQWFTNICCISLCPLIMVIISAALGKAIQALIQSTTKVEEILYCSNINALNSFNVPIFNATDSRIPTIAGSLIDQATTESVKAVNFLSVDGDASRFTASGPTSSKPCVYWFGRDYPESSLYERPVTNLTEPYYVYDTTYTSQPSTGWIGLLFQRAFNADLITSLQTLQNLQIRPWFLFSSADGVDSTQIGTRPEKPQSLDTTALSSISDVSASDTNGFLDTFEEKIWGNVTSGRTGVSINGYQSVPYFEASSGDDSSITTSSDFDDDSLAKKIQGVFDELARIDKSVLFAPEVNQTELLGYYSEINKILVSVPYGGVRFDRVDLGGKQHEWTLQIGTDKRISASGTFPGAGQRRLVAQTQLDNAILKFTNTSSTLVSAKITQGLRAMPQLKSTELDIPIAGSIGAILFPFGVSFLLPIFVVTLVKEKEDRIFVMMKMNGLHSITYFASHYITFFILTSISSIIFVIAGYGTGLELFTQTSLEVLALVLVIWSLVQNALVFFFGSFFNKSRIALVVVFIIVLCGVIISLVSTRLFEKGQFPTAMFLWPPFAFYRALQLLNEAGYKKTEAAYSYATLIPGDEVFTAVQFMWVEAIIILLLAFYIAAVLPSEFGVPRPWHFPVSDIYNKFTKKGVTPEVQTSKTVLVEEEIKKLEDEDVCAERERIDEGRYDTECPLVMKHLRKVYPPRAGLGPKLAVRDMTLALDKGVVMGLLGPNGAGKTTTISMLTGLYRSTSGDASLAGYDIHSDIRSVYKNIGICPQFDILWDDLTVGEHLYFYARLKGIQIKDENQVVQDSLRKVSLEPFEDRKTKGLSGGEKRRLSIAISLIGSPKVVFLDEPTTGLDPEVRRLIWTIVNEAREGKTIVLTTHSMEEAEALCMTIGIMAKGTLRCLGNALRLKELYGSGFKLFFNSDAENTSKACEFIESVLPKGFKKMDAFTTNTSYEFPSAPGVISTLFKVVEEKKKEYGIVDWGVSQTTLEEVFLKIISETDAEG